MAPPGPSNRRKFRSVIIHYHHHQINTEITPWSLNTAVHRPKSPAPWRRSPPSPQVINEREKRTNTRGRPSSRARASHRSATIGGRWQVVRPHRGWHAKEENKARLKVAPNNASSALTRCRRHARGSHRPLPSSSLALGRAAHHRGRAAQSWPLFCVMSATRLKPPRFCQYATCDLASAASSRSCA